MNVLYPRLANTFVGDLVFKYNGASQYLVIEKNQDSVVIISLNSGLVDCIHPSWLTSEAVPSSNFKIGDQLKFNSFYRLEPREFLTATGSKEHIDFSDCLKRSFKCETRMHNFWRCFQPDTKIICDHIFDNLRICVKCEGANWTAFQIFSASNFVLDSTKIIDEPPVGILARKARSVRNVMSRIFS